jgi:hypothetical protein
MYRLSFDLDLDVDPCELLSLLQDCIPQLMSDLEIEDHEVEDSAIDSASVTHID